VKEVVYCEAPVGWFSFELLPIKLIIHDVFTYLEIVLNFTKSAKCHFPIKRLVEYYINQALFHFLGLRIEVDLRFAEGCQVGFSL